MAHTGPLAGIRILEFSQLVAGAVAGLPATRLGGAHPKVDHQRG